MPRERPITRNILPLYLLSDCKDTTFFRNIQIFSSKKKESRNKFNKTAFTSNFKDIKIKRNDNKENIRPCYTNIDGLNPNNNNGTQIRLFGKGGNLTGTGVNKWINLNKLIKYEQSKTANHSNIGGLLNNGNYDS